MRPKATIQPLPYWQIFSLAWSPDGQQLATVCKDGRVRVYEPLRGPEPLQVNKCIWAARHVGVASPKGSSWASCSVSPQEGPGPEGARGARIVWVCDGRCLLVSGFDR